METRLFKPSIDVPTPHGLSTPKNYPSNKLARHSAASQDSSVFSDNAGLARYV